MTKELSEMEVIQERLDEVGDQVKHLNTNVDLMLTLLRGNELNIQDRGMIGKIAELEKRLSVLEKYKDRMFWVLITAAAITGLNLVQLIDLAIGAFKH